MGRVPGLLVAVTVVVGSYSALGKQLPLPVPVLPPSVPAPAPLGAPLPGVPSPAAQTAIPDSAVPALTVRFEGGDVPANASRVLSVLNKLQLMPSKSVAISKGKTLCDVYLTMTAFPLGCTKDLVQLASDINHKNYAQASVQIGDLVQYPDVSFTSKGYVKRYDSHVPAEQKALQDLTENWPKSVLRNERLANGVDRLVLRGWELKVPMPSLEDAQRATRQLAAAHIQNITFSHPEAEKPLLKANAVISPGKYIQNCQAGTLQQGDQCAYSLMLGLDRLDWVHCARKCPDLFLLDQPVRKNPALLATVADGFGDDPDPGPAAVSPCGLPPLKDGDHGTHLAGIIGALGPTCVGLNPSARIHSWNREVDASVTSDDIERVQDHYDHNGATVGLPIFLSATSWAYPRKNGQAGERLDRLEDRFNNPIATEIRNHGALWIVAAGQPDPTRNNERTVEITGDIALSPMNLGDERNVLVVSACLDCVSDRPALRPGVNYSRTLVHIAAPGDDVPGLAGVRRLGLAGGTSQAAAFTAGVVTAMVAKYPNDFTRPELVKSRLQYTSRPVLTGQDAEHVATGVIDPSVAMLDPEKDYLQRRAGSMNRLVLESWCTSEIRLMNPSTGRPIEKGAIRTRDLLRLYRVNRDDANAPAQWIAYTKVPWDTKPGEVLRIGPGVFTLSGGRPNQPAPLVKEKAGSGIPPSRIEDLLVHDPAAMKVAACGA